MKQIIFYTTFVLCSFLGKIGYAQSLGEDPYIRYYLGRNIHESRLFSETGLGKVTLLENVPNEWIYVYQRLRTMNDIAALFGQISPTFRTSYRRNTFLGYFQGSHLGESDLGLTGRFGSKKINNYIRVNGHWNNTKHDNNQDDFLDIPFQQRLFVHNTLRINLDRFTSINTISYFNRKTQAGQWQFDYPNDYLTTNAYGYGQAMQHFVGESINYISIRKKDLLTLQFRAVDHGEQHFYGLRQYTGKQWGIDTRAIYTYTLDNAVDQFRIGLNYHNNVVREQLDTLDIGRNESYGGGFVGYETSIGPKFHLSTRFNIIYHNLAKWVLLPHAKLDFKITKQLYANVFGGGGMRFANVLNENQQFLLSNRNVQVKEPLEAERAWNYGLSIAYNHWWRGNSDLFTSFKLQAEHTLYDNKIIADLDAGAYALQFYNLDGKAEKFTLELDVSFQLPKPRIDIGLDYRLDWYAATINGEYRQLPLQSMHTLMAAINYRQIFGYYKKYLNFSTQFYWYSPQRLPDASAKGSMFGLASTGVFRWDARVEAPINLFTRLGRDIGGKFRIHFFVGMDNILQNIQQNPFIAAEQPFGQDFDGGLAWQSTVGRRFYAGFRFSVF